MWSNYTFYCTRRMCGALIQMKAVCRWWSHIWPICFDGRSKRLALSEVEKRHLMESEQDRKLSMINPWSAAIKSETCWGWQRSNTSDVLIKIALLSELFTPLLKLNNTVSLTLQIHSVWSYLDFFQHMNFELMWMLYLFCVLQHTGKCKQARVSSRHWLG